MLKIPKLNTEQEDPNIYKPNKIWRIVSDIPEVGNQWRREWLGSFIGEQLAVPYSVGTRGRQVDMERVTLDELRMYGAGNT